MRGGAGALAYCGLGGVHSAGEGADGGAQWGGGGAVLAACRGGTVTWIRALTGPAPHWTGSAGPAEPHGTRRGRPGVTPATAAAIPCMGPACRSRAPAGLATRSTGDPEPRERCARLLAGVAPHPSGGRLCGGGTRRAAPTGRRQAGCRPRLIVQRALQQLEHRVQAWACQSGACVPALGASCWRCRLRRRCRPVPDACWAATCKAAWARRVNQHSILETTISVQRLRLGQAALLRAPTHGRRRGAIPCTVRHAVARRHAPATPAACHAAPEVDAHPVSEPGPCSCLNVPGWAKTPCVQWRQDCHVSGGGRTPNGGSSDGAGGALALTILPWARPQQRSSGRGPVFSPPPRAAPAPAPSALPHHRAAPAQPLRIAGAQLGRRRR